MTTKPKMTMNGADSRIDRIVFACHALCEDFRRFVRFAHGSASRQGLGEVLRWNSMLTEKASSAFLDNGIAALPASASGPPSAPVFLSYMTGAHLVVSYNFYPDSDGVAVCALTVNRVRAAGDRPQDLLAFHDFSVTLAGALMREFDIYAARLNAEPGGEFLPFAPLVEGASQLCVADDAAVAEGYRRPDDFWNAGWSVLDEHDGKRLLGRHLDLLGGPEFLKRVLDHQWTMARAASPGMTVYRDPVVRQEEYAVFHSGERRLHSVGYQTARAELEYSCVLERGQHVQGWEIFALRKIVVDGKSTEGWPVRSIRVVFLEEWMAAQEKRPLLDIGCRVWFYNGEGALEEMTE